MDLTIAVQSRERAVETKRSSLSGNQQVKRDTLLLITHTNIILQVLQIPGFGKHRSVPSNFFRIQLELCRFNVIPNF